ncbi:hypothetical protein C0Q70_09702 [Pomacea canaliculata]|uniref:Uncharacterized protein n=1 Tax=Pomacea canaliculata TaxID=400727 RepID=A0A2T7PAK0_POMCA|nr:hypothetical protein C0Q70_09702 [Pomacea canaliculata]
MTEGGSPTVVHTSPCTLVANLFARGAVPSCAGEYEIEARSSITLPRLSSRASISSGNILTPLPGVPAFIFLTFKCPSPPSGAVLLIAASGDPQQKSIHLSTKLVRVVPSPEN